MPRSKTNHVSSVIQVAKQISPGNGKNNDRDGGHNINSNNKSLKESRQPASFPGERTNIIRNFDDFDSYDFAE